MSLKSKILIIFMTVLLLSVFTFPVYAQTTAASSDIELNSGNVYNENFYIRSGITQAILKALALCNNLGFCRDLSSLFSKSWHTKENTVVPKYNYWSTAYENANKIWQYALLQNLNIGRTSPVRWSHASAVCVGKKDISDSNENMATKDEDNIKEMEPFKKLTEDSPKIAWTSVFTAPRLKTDSQEPTNYDIKERQIAPNAAADQCGENTDDGKELANTETKTERCNPYAGNNCNNQPDVQEKQNENSDVYIKYKTGVNIEEAVFNLITATEATIKFSPLDETRKLALKAGGYIDTFRFGLLSFSDPESKIHSTIKNSYSTEREAAKINSNMAWVGELSSQLQYQGCALTFDALQPKVLPITKTGCRVYKNTSPSAPVYKRTL
jgi:hypothetical protein